MFRLIAFAVYILVGYVVGAMLSEHIFLDLSFTHWNNLWVYFWLILWPVGIVVTFFFWCLIILVVVMVVLGVYSMIAR